MRKQDAILSFFTIIFFTSILTLLLGQEAVAKQQQILLDVNGKPLSDEVLLLLSSSVKKIDEIQVDASKKTDSKLEKDIEDKTDKSDNDKSEEEVTPKITIKKRKLINNPLLEKELLHSLIEGNAQRAVQLAKAGVKPIYKNSKGETPLGIAVVKGWATMVLLLIENDADVHEKGAGKTTLLHKASAHGLLDIAKLLVKHGLDPKKLTKKDWSTLHLAARYGHWQLVQYFIKQGVDPNIRNSDGKTALGLARHLRHQGIIKILAPVTTRKSLTKKKKRKKRRRSRQKKKEVIAKDTVEALL